MADPKTKKDPSEEQDPKPQPPVDPTGNPPAGDPPVADPATDPVDPKEPPAADPADPANPPAADPVNDPAPINEEVVLLKQQLLEANSRNAAYKAGVKATAVDDAVVLAMHAVKLSGEKPSEEAVGKAIAAVLERHPEWSVTSTPVAPAQAGAEPPAEPAKSNTNAILHGKVVL